MEIYFKRVNLFRSIPILTKPLFRCSQTGLDDLIATKQPGRYDEAISLLIDLRDVANRKGKMKEFIARVTLLHKQHEKKPSFLKRMGKAGL